MPAKRKHSAQHRATVKRHRRRLANLSASAKRRLAAVYYVAAKGVGRDGLPDAQAWTGAGKRAVMRQAKAYARARLTTHAIVELRATDELGGIIERVRLASPGRWVNDFET